MFRFTRVLVAPSRGTLHAALEQVAAEVEKECPTWPLRWSNADTDGLLQSVAGAREGAREWTSEAARQEQLPGNEPTSTIGVFWWRDCLNRPHYRIVADVVRPPGPHPWQHLRARPPLWVIYPEDLYFQEEGRRWYLIASCRCGATGPPAALGWMGPWCGGCHDRTEAGDRIPIPRGVPRQRLLESPRPLPERLAFALNDSALVTHGADQAAVWDLATAQRKRIHLGLGRTGHLVVSPDGETAVITSYSQVILYSLRDRKVRHVVTIPREEMTIPPGHGPASGRSPSSAININGSVVVTRVVGSAVVWDVFGDQLLRRTVLDLEEMPWALAVSADGGTLLAALGGRQVAPPDLGEFLVADIVTREVRRLSMLAFDHLHCVAFHPDGRHVAAVGSGADGHALALWDTQAGVVRRSPMANPGATALAFAPDGRMLAVAGAYGTLLLYTLPDLALLGAYQWEITGASALAFSRGGQWLATTNSLGLIKLWPLEALLSLPPMARRDLS
jgi:hypothetical protein